MSGIKPFETTVEEIEFARRELEEAPLPGLVLISSCERPAVQAFPLENGTLELGRAQLIDDDRASRRHARVSFDGARWTIADLESRNGTFVEGERLSGEVVRGAPRVLRVGRSLLVFEANVRRFKDGVATADGLVAGPRLREVHAAIERAALFGDTLFVRGESGSGKELAAKAFHGFGGRSAQPFVAVNCAAIPEGLAERLLFGAKKGAYSGAVADAEGYLQAASGGTLFLDEIAELDLAVQAKLLRVLETREVIALGDATPRRIELRVCSATHRDLREAVGAGTFREDLYFRLGRPEIWIPPLRERLEEIPWHIARELERLGQGFVPHVAFVEACLLRRWPGNVRELRAEVRRAAQEAIAAGRREIETIDLPVAAGAGFTRAATREPAAEERPSGEVPIRRGTMPDREAIEGALRAEIGNVTRAARRLGLHRNQLRRWIDKNAVDPRTFGEGADDDDG